MVEATDFEIDLPGTWPERVRGLVKQERETMIAFHRECEKIDRLMAEDVKARIDPPENSYRRRYENILAQAEEFLSGHRMVGYHCTRLTAAETRSVREQGLVSLSELLLRNRMRALVEVGEMADDVFQYIVGHHHFQDSLGDRYGRRTGQVWLCPNRSSLQSAEGVYRLLRSWGGEALYIGFEDDPSVSTLLTRIGKPTIVKCAVSLPLDELHGCRAAHLLSYAVCGQINHPEPPARFDLCVRRSLEPSEVLDVISIDDYRFEKFTGYLGWESRHRIV